MNLFEHLEVPYEEDFQRRDETGRFTPIRLIKDQEDVGPTTDAILELVLRQFENARDFIPALEWVVYETVDNIRLHADTAVPGTVCAQYFPTRQRLDVAICDLGQGISGSLEHHLDPWEGPGDAIKMALKRGVTRDQEVGQGNGLPGAVEIAEENEGEFRIWTDEVVYEVEGGKEKGFQQRPRVEGTGVVVRFDTTNPVQLSDTFMGQPTWTYIDSQVQRIGEEGGLEVVEDCQNTGTREPAGRLRRKVQTLLPDVDGALTLDFDGVGTASSSFLDELLGRLVDELGQETFSREIRLVNIPDEMVDMANVVIGQRVDSDDSSSFTPLE
jgi:anti-sigma regulatory factor (Ser/Thr protein kinase)